MKSNINNIYKTYYKCSKCGSSATIQLHGEWLCDFHYDDIVNDTFKSAVHYYLAMKNKNLHE